MQLYLEMTDAQKKLVKPLLKLASEASKKGEKGIVIAQVFDDVIRIGFLDNEKAKLFEKTARNL